MKESSAPRRTSRAESAAATRRRVLAAAEALLIEQGWSATTIRQIAAAADVSPETVYKGFGGKAGLLKGAYDVRIAGDDAPVAIAQREGVARLLAARTAAEAAGAWAEHAVRLHTRSAPLMALALTAQANEPALADFVRTVEAERMTGADRTTAHWESRGWLRVPQPEARDRLWLLGSPGSYLDLSRLGWGEDQVLDWYRAGALGLVLTPG